MHGKHDREKYDQKSSNFAELNLLFISKILLDHINVLKTF